MARLPLTTLMLLLLVISSLGASSAPVQHLCGSQLVDALYFVCGERGFFHHQSQIHRRDLEHPLGFLSKRVELERQQLWRTLSTHDEPKVKRGIVEHCCHKPCSIYHLEDYCD
ncbi:preproinsulin b [Gouania willdenowi]|uniref:preproinsulin b n=1 Tax=Gouania willdenowi TaxID=441366 RepID=UPI0010556B59|nr:insulin-like [Gouania willdenowi]